MSEYYQSLIEAIKKHIDNKDYNLALELIDNELNMPYVPSDYLSILKGLKSQIPKESKSFNLSDEEIFEYLKGNEQKQLIAVDTLNKRNLRNYIDICNKYLVSDGFINAKVLLIDSLIKQEITEEISYSNDGLDYSFIPKYIMSPEESFGYKTAILELEKVYMKDPSKLELSKSLVYRECVMALPLNYDQDEGYLIACKVNDYIEKAFN